MSFNIVLENQSDFCLYFLCTFCLYFSTNLVQRKYKQKVQRTNLKDEGPRTKELRVLFCFLPFVCTS